MPIGAELASPTPCEAPECLRPASAYESARERDPRGEGSWREYNGFLVHNFIGGTVASMREEHGLGKPSARGVPRAWGDPIQRRRGHEIYEVDFDSFLDDVLCQGPQEGFLRLQLIERGIDKIDARMPMASC